MNTENAPSYQKGLWSTKQACQFIGCAEVTLRTWRRAGTGPPFLRLNKRQIRYRPEEVSAWLDRCRATSTSAVTTEERSRLAISKSAS